MRLTFCLLAALAVAPPARAQDPKGAAAPRRLLVVQVADYVYANPLAAGRVREAAARLALGLRVPVTKDNDQLFVVSDALAADAPLPTKDVLVQTLDGFCSTTRAQDRVVLYVGAHAVERDGKAFVLPIDADPNAPAADLLAVADVYAKLRDLKAAQKVVIWDVCRRNPERARGRAAPGPMTEALFKALTAAPDGVQVIVTSAPSQWAHESFPRTATVPLSGSDYLDALASAATENRAANPKAAHGDPIPLEALHKAVRGKGQTVTLVGAEPKGAAALDAKEPSAKRFAPAPGSKPNPDAKAIFDELALPAFAEGDRAPLARLAFAADALKGYEADVSPEDIMKAAAKYPLRAATLSALAAARASWKLDNKEQRAVVAVPAPIGLATKRLITTAQEQVALALVDLELHLLQLEDVADKRGKEPKRWQAHYDYTVAEVRLRLAVLNEYNRVLGLVRTEGVPDLPPGGTGWRLVPSPNVQRKDVKLMYEKARAEFENVTVAHKGTPWAVLARRGLAALPGARWEAVAPPKAEGK
ncbi:MAG: caspase family protein [Planctomycetes bacterium]|nr:caspase family protein [Planctomycetota bacterium]